MVPFIFIFGKIIIHGDSVPTTLNRLRESGNGHPQNGLRPVGWGHGNKYIVFSEPVVVAVPNT